MADQDRNPDALEFELDDYDRRHLREMVRHPGYAVLRKIQQAYLDSASGTAAALSRVDPLSNRDAIASRWAYVAVAEQYLAQMTRAIDFEFAILDKNDNPKTPPADLLRRRRLHALSGSLEPMPEE